MTCEARLSLEKAEARNRDRPRQTETDPQESNPSRVIFIGNDSLPGHSLPVLATCFRPGTQEQTDHRKAWIFSNEDLNQIACVG